MHSILSDRRVGPIAVLLLCLAVLGGCSGSAPPTPVYFGHLAPRTGSLRELGLDAEKGILLAIEELKARDELVAGHTVVVLHADSRGDPDVVQSAAVRLLTINHVAGLMGGADPNTAERLCKVAQQYKVPVLTPAWLPPATLGPYGFCVGAAPAAQGKALARLAVKNLAAKQVVVLTDNRSSAAPVLTGAFVDALAKDATASPLEYGDKTDFTALATQVVKAKPNAILLAGTVADLEKLWAELPKAGLPNDVSLLFGGADDPRLPALAESAKLYWTTVFLADAGPKAERFAAKFEERFHRPSDVAAALAYDSTRLLCEAIRQANGTRGDKMRDGLLKIKDFDGLTGPLSFDKNQVADRSVFVVHRKDGRVKAVRGP